MAGRALLLRAEPGFSLPAFERFAPPPPPALVAARLEAQLASRATSCSTCSAAAAGSRAPRSTSSARAISLESTALDRLLAEIVLRPPDLRHLDAAIQALAASARRESSLKASITDRFASRCATCDRPVVLDELTWAAEATDEDGRRGRPARPQALPLPGLPRPAGRRRAAPGPARRPGPRPRAATPRASSCGARSPTGSRSLEGGEDLPRRAARPPHAAPAGRARRDPRADRGRPPRRADRGGAPARAAPRARAREPPRDVARAGSPRSGSRTGTSRSRAPRSGASGTRGSRSRTASGSSAASSSGWRAARGARCRRGSATTSGASSRGRDGRRQAVARRRRSGRSSWRRSTSSRGGARPRIRLVARDAAAPAGRRAARLGVPRDGMGPRPRGRRDAPARAAVRAGGPPGVGLAGGGDHAEPARRRAGARAGRPDRVPARGRRDRRRSSRCVLGGVTAGYRLAAARLPEAGRESGGVVELVPPGLGRHPGRPADPRERRRSTRCRAAPATRTSCPAERLFAPAERVVNAPFSAQDATRAVVDAAVDVLKLRGEPVTFDGLVGEILVGLDRAGHLRRLVRPPAAEAAPDAAAPGRPPPEPVPITSSACSPSIRERPRRAPTAAGWRSRRRPLVAGRPHRPRPRRRAARRPGRVGGLQPPVDRRAAVRGAVPRPDREPVHRPRPPRRGARPRLPRLLPEPRQHARPARSPPTTSSGAARSTAS